MVSWAYLIVPIMIAILFLLHYYIYGRLKRVLKVNRYFLAFALGLLTASFILMEIIERHWSNKITNTLYFFSSVWLGVLFFLVFGFALLDLINFLLKLAKAKTNYRQMGGMLLVFILIITIYSIINATTVTVNHLDLQFPNLEKDLKVVQISDAHIGVVHSTSYIEQIVQKTNALNPDMILITGDFFDESNDIQEDDISPLKNLNARYGTYFVTGNHETYFGKEKAIKWLEN